MRVEVCREHEKHTCCKKLIIIPCFKSGLNVSIVRINMISNMLPHLESQSVAGCGKQKVYSWCFLVWEDHKVRQRLQKDEEKKNIVQCSHMFLEIKS